MEIPSSMADQIFHPLLRGSDLQRQHLRCHPIFHRQNDVPFYRFKENPIDQVSQQRETIEEIPSQGLRNLHRRSKELRSQG